MIPTFTPTCKAVGPTGFVCGGALPCSLHPVGTVDAIHMREANGPCQVHDWPTEGMAVRLVERMRASHGKGGVNVCVDCIARARLSVDVLRKT